MSDAIDAVVGLAKGRLLTRSFVLLSSGRSRLIESGDRFPLKSSPKRRLLIVYSASGVYSSRNAGRDTAACLPKSDMMSSSVDKKSAAAICGQEYP